MYGLTEEQPCAKLACAFLRFFARRCPVMVDTRIYTSAHSGFWHSHDYPQLWICLQGRYFHRVQEQIVKCEKGSAVVVPPGFRHFFRISEGETAEIMSVSLTYDFFLDTPPELYTNAIANMFLPPFAKELGYAIPIFRTLSPESLAAVRDHTSWLSSLDFQVITEMTNVQMYRTIEAMFSLPEFALPEEYRNRAVKLTKTWLHPVIRVLAWLNMHYPERNVEDDLVKVAGIGHTEFFRRFRRYTGYTYSIYLQRLRIQHVDAYLMHTDYPIVYISDICGFVSQAYMTKIYKRYVGLTPRRRRIEHKQWLAEHPEQKLHMTGF